MIVAKTAAGLPQIGCGLLRSLVQRHQPVMHHHRHKAHRQGGVGDNEGQQSPRNIQQTRQSAASAWSCRNPMLRAKRKTRLPQCPANIVNCQH